MALKFYIYDMLWKDRTGQWRIFLDKHSPCLQVLVRDLADNSSVIWEYHKNKISFKSIIYGLNSIVIDIGRL